MELKPGPELDALVAEKVMGWRWAHDGLGNMAWYAGTTKSKWGEGGVAGEQLLPFRPSTDIAAAWEVVEKMRVKRVFISVGHSIDMSDTADHAYVATAEYFTYDEHREQKVLAPTAPHAICLAALKAVGYSS